MNLPKQISLTRLANANTCLMQYYLRHDQGWQMKEVAVALSKGRYFHALDAGEEIDWADIGSLDSKDKEQVDRVFARWKVCSSQLFDGLEMQHEVEFGTEIDGITVTGRADRYDPEHDTIIDVKTTSSYDTRRSLTAAAWQLNMLNLLSGGSTSANLGVIGVKLVLPEVSGKVRKSKFLDKYYFEHEIDYDPPPGIEKLPDIAPIFDEHPIVTWTREYCFRLVRDTLDNIASGRPVPIYNNMICGFCDYRELCNHAMPAGRSIQWLESNCIKKERKSDETQAV